MSLELTESAIEYTKSAIQIILQSQRYFANSFTLTILFICFVGRDGFQEVFIKTPCQR